jgi:hypothetical protein
MTSLMDADEDGAGRPRLRGHPGRPQLPGLPADTADVLALVHAVVADCAAGDAAPAVEPVRLLAALTALRHLRDELASWEPQLITVARERGVSWARLAPALGVTSRQAAERRYLRLRPSATGEHTGEGRVQAERDRRAGDRAVQAWARQNSGTLRRLAGQVSALEGLTTPAQQRVDLIQDALVEDDPAALLPPLADAHSYLATSHVGLAEQIRSVGEQTEQVRRGLHGQRGSTS